VLAREKSIPKRYSRMLRIKLELRVVRRTVENSSLQHNLKIKTRKDCFDFYLI